MAAAPLLVMAACSSSNPVCAPEVRDRLLDDCQLSTSPVPSNTCLQLSGAPVAGELRSPAFLAQHDAACEAYDQQGVDAECLKTSACADIYAGACTTNATASASLASCVAACQVTLRSCDEACASSADYDSCSKCQLDCIDPLVACESACQDAESS